MHSYKRTIFLWWKSIHRGNYLDQSFGLMVQKNRNNTEVPNQTACYIFEDFYYGHLQAQSIDNDAQTHILNIEFEMFFFFIMNTYALIKFT
jgi:hypothetical protein